MKLVLVSGGIIHEVSCFGKPRGSSRSGGTGPSTCNLRPGIGSSGECVSQYQAGYIVPDRRARKIKKIAKGLQFRDFKFRSFQAKWIVLILSKGRN